MRSLPIFACLCLFSLPIRLAAEEGWVFQGSVGVVENLETSEVPNVAFHALLGIGYR